MESEGFDRTSLALPGHQDELVRRIVAANPRTVVVVNSGAPVLLPWLEEAPAGAQASVDITLPRRAFQHWDADSGGWLVEPGEFAVHIGPSSAVTPLERTVAVLP